MTRNIKPIILLKYLLTNLFCFAQSISKFVPTKNLEPTRHDDCPTSGTLNILGMMIAPNPSLLLCIIR